MTSSATDPAQTGPPTSDAAPDSSQVTSSTSEDFGSADSDQHIERLPAAAAAPANTGGGNVSGINELTTLDDGTQSATIVPATGNGTRPGLFESVEKVGGESAATSQSMEATLSAVKRQATEAKTALALAERTAEKTRSGLADAEEEEVSARRMLGRTAAASYVNGHEPAMPELLDAAGALLDASVDTEYSAAALGVAEQALDTSETSLAAAQQAVIETEADLQDAEAAADLADEIVAEVTAARDQSAATSDALLIASPGSPAPEPSDPSDTPVSANTPSGSPEAPSTVVDVQVNDPGLNALVAAGNPVTFPVAGAFDFIDSWGYARSGGRTHKGADIFAERGTPVVALEAGSLRYKSNSLGGLTIYLDGVSGNSYYYAHLESRVDGLDGQSVSAGQIIGTVGTSGNAVGTPPHLHFEIKPAGGASQNPYPALRAIADAVT